MNPEDVPDVAAFLDELHRESDRGLALVAAAVLDEKLLETLQAFMCECTSAGRLLTSPNAPLGTLSARADACHALGLIESTEHSEISLVRKIRNEFAHAKHGLTFQNEKVRGLCASLQSDLPQGADYPLQDPRFRFTNAAASLALRLYYRPAWVTRERRAAKQWIDPAQCGWRSIEDEPPPADVPVMVMAKRAASPERQ